ncbi:hypothetical protein GCM10029964_032400 [Kibdelosporangium lantanae]
MTTTAQEFWEDFYQEHDQVWSGRPNQLLVREIAELTPEQPWTWAAAKAATPSGWPNTAGGSPGSTCPPRR